MSILARTLVCLLACLLSACAAPPVRNYIPPTAGEGEPLAKIVGYLIEHSLGIDDEIFWVDEVDGVSVHVGGHRSRRAGHGDPVLLVPGRHVLVVAYSQGLRLTAASFSVTVRPGQVLLAKGRARDSSVVDRMAGKDSVLLWIEDMSTGEVLGRRIEAPLRY